MSNKSLKSRKRDNAEEMYAILNEFRRVIYVEGGDPDAIMNVASKALAIIRKIDLCLKEPPINIVSTEIQKYGI